MNIRIRAHLFFANITFELGKTKKAIKILEKVLPDIEFEWIYRHRKFNENSSKPIIRRKFRKLIKITITFFYNIAIYYID